jgi:transcriptional regulator with XRE-family HTH domain
VSVQSGAPDSTDEPVGVVLARLRRARGWSGARLAAMVGMSQPKISRLERGVGTPDPADVGKVARALGANEQVAVSLIARAERSHDRMTDWRPASTGLTAQQMSVGRWEAAARVIDEFDPALVPGLLQSSGYAKEVLQKFQRINAIDAETSSELAVAAAVSERIRRQEILADPGKSFHFILTEAVLRNEICKPAEMLAQIGRIRESALYRASVEITVILDETQADVPPLHGFTLIDNSLVIVDAYNAGLVSGGRKDIESYRRVFESFAAQASPVEPVLDKYETYYIERLSRSPRSKS